MMHVTMFTTCLDFDSNTWEISAWLPPGCCRHGVSVHCTWVQIASLYATRWQVFPTCMQLILVGWYVASMLCCHCWMLSLSDALPMQSYPSKAWFHLVWPCRSLRGTTYLFSTDLFFYMKSVVYLGQHFKDVDFMLSNVHFNSLIWFSA